eukprot:8512098-Pyramimonas_sp.AAC.1
MTRRREARAPQGKKGTEQPDPVPSAVRTNKKSLLRVSVTTFSSFSSSSASSALPRPCQARSQTTSRPVSRTEMPPPTRAVSSVASI